MAYDASNEERKEIGKIKKNDRGDYIVITQIDNKKSGNCSIDLRNYYTDDNDELKPTQKGVRFNAEMLQEIVEILQNAIE